MLGIYVEVTDNGALDEYISICENFPEFVNDVVTDTVEDMRMEILQDFQQEPPPVKWPINWTSDKQRRFVYRNISRQLWVSPLNRSHDISSSWKVISSFVPGRLTSVEIVNDAPGVEFVEGEFQQKWNKETGWLDAGEKEAEWSEKLGTRIGVDLGKAFSKGKRRGR